MALYDRVQDHDEQRNSEAYCEVDEAALTTVLRAEVGLPSCRNGFELTGDADERSRYANIATDA